MFRLLVYAPQMSLILVEAEGCQVPWNWSCTYSYPPCCLPKSRAQGLSSA